MRQGNILNEATAVSPATFLGEAIRILILIAAPQTRAGASRTGSDRSPIKSRTDPRSPRLRNPDQLRRGERYRCALRPNRGSILNAD
jgi:hypothetical protein